MVAMLESTGSDAEGAAARRVAVPTRRRRLSARTVWLAVAVVLAAAAVYFYLALITPCACARAEEMTKAQEKVMVDIFQEQQVANQLFHAGRYEEAEGLYRDVLAKTEAAFPGEGLMRASSLHDLAAALAEMGRLQEAYDLAKEALTLREAQAERASSMAIGSSRALLASILRDLGRRAEGNALMRQAFLVVASDPKGDQGLLVENATKLIGVLAEDGQLTEVDKLAGDLLGVVEQVPDNLKIEIYWSVARARSEAGRTGEADRYYREAYGLLVKVFPDDLTRRAILISNIASVLRKEYRPADAEQLFRRAAADLEKLYPDGHPALAAALDGLALSITEQNRPAEAWPIGRRALDMRLALLPDDHPLIATSLVNLGLALIRDGQVELARDAFQTAVTRRQKAGDEVGAARAAISLAVAQAALGDNPGGINSLDNARAVFEASLPQGHPLATTAAIDQAWLLLAAGEPAKALVLARDAARDLVAARAVAGGELEATPPEEDKRRIVVAVAAAWDVAEGK